MDWASLYARHFQGRLEVRSWAPGRVNLIGEHTDYNEGYVLPLAVDRGVGFAGSARSDRKVVLYSADYDRRVEFSLDELNLDRKNPWANYFKGVADQLQKKGVKLKGCQAVLKGDLPQGAGLSSSAALEVSSAVFLKKISSFQLEDMNLVKSAQAAENQFVGVHCGIMDQYASYLGRAGQALLIDCRSLEGKAVSIGSGVQVVVCNSGVKRSLAGSAYNERRRECEEGVEALRKVLPDIRALRDVSVRDLEKHQGLLSPIVLKRVRHIVTENQRVLAMVEALGEADWPKVGKLLYESHNSLRDDYEVSCEELDALVEIAQNNPQVIGGRMTGAGFGGCTVNLVTEAEVKGFQREIEEGYPKITGRKAEVYVFSPADGAKYSNL
jgi:galactokinase